MNECLSLLATALGTLIKNVDPVGQNISITQIMMYLNGLREPLYPEKCCENCTEANEVIASVTKTLTHVDPVNAARALAKILCIIVDSVGDEELSRDISDQIVDTLFPDDKVEQRFH